MLRKDEGVFMQKTRRKENQGETNKKKQKEQKKQRKRKKEKREDMP